jgi:hypothetical protein
MPGQEAGNAGRWMRELATTWERITQEHLAAFRAVTLQGTPGVGLSLEPSPGAMEGSAAAIEAEVTQLIPEAAGTTTTTSRAGGEGATPTTGGEMPSSPAVEAEEEEEEEANAAASRPVTRRKASATAAAARKGKAR